MICMHPECQETAKARGLCANHYSQAWQLVKAGETTWEQLVKDKKCLSKSPSKTWFLNEEKGEK